MWRVLALLLALGGPASAQLIVPGGGSSSGGTPGGVNGQLQINNAGAFGGITLGGDCTFATPNITCTKTSGVAFGTAATQNTGTSGATIPLLNASNTWSGQQTLASGSISANTPTTLTQTWNNVAVAFSALTVNVTDTSSASAGASGPRLLSLQVAGSEKMGVGKNGDIFAPNLYGLAASSQVQLGASSLGLWANTITLGNSAGTSSVAATFPANGAIKFDGMVGTKSTTVSGLVAASTAGAGSRAFVTDATACTFGSTVTGGGSTACPVYSDGTNWKGG